MGVVGTYAVVQFGSMPADMVEKAVEKSTRPEAADRWVVYFSDRNLKNARLKGLQTAEFIASIAPISSTSTAILDGRFVDAAISFVGDIAFAGAFRGLWIGKAAAQASNAAKLAQANTAILRFQSIQSVIVVTHIGQAGYAVLQDENGKAAGYVGEAILRIFGIAYARRISLPATAAPSFANPNFIGPLTLEQHYARAVLSNRQWSWVSDIPGGANLTRAQKMAIKNNAIAQGLIPNIPFKPGTEFLDLERAGLVQRVDVLPGDLWLARDRAQFDWLNARIPGGRPPGMTWHHSEIPGRMELVPFGPHNVTPHIGGRSPGMWAHAPR